MITDRRRPSSIVQSDVYPETGKRFFLHPARHLPSRLAQCCRLGKYSEPLTWQRIRQTDDKALCKPFFAAVKINYISLMCFMTTKKARQRA